MLCDPGKHFNGRFEVERKYRVAELDSVRSEVLSMGAVPFMLGNRETDIFLDQPDGRLAANGQQLVVRQMQPSGRVLWICKGPGAEQCVAMDLDGQDKALQMLSALGYQQAGRLVKNRDIYFLGDFHLTFDHLAGLGTFVEIAVMTDDAGSLAQWAERLEEFAATLGLTSSQIEHRSYRTMMTGSSRTQDAYPA